MPKGSSGDQAVVPDASVPKASNGDKAVVPDASVPNHIIPPGQASPPTPIATPSRAPRPPAGAFVSPATLNAKRAPSQKVQEPKPEGYWRFLGITNEYRNLAPAKTLVI